MKALSGQNVKRVELLGRKGKLRWGRTRDGLIVRLPEKPPCDFAATLRIAAVGEQ